MREIVKNKFMDLNPGIIPHVAAIHDICGYGNCSLGIALPVLAAAGIDCCPVPTAYLSAHTGFPSYTFFDTTEHLEEFFAHWKKIEIPLAGVYTGFLGSVRQIDIIRKFFGDFSDLAIVVDPVMGDHGEIYKTYTPDMCTQMKKLVAVANVVTPNVTEAYILADEAYQGQNISTAKCKALCKKIHEIGAENIVLKGIERENGEVINVISEGDGTYTEIFEGKINAALHGTGDLFASAITAGLFSRKTLQESTEFAAKFVYQAIELSLKQPGYQDRGVSYEPLLKQVAEFCLT